MNLIWHHKGQNVQSTNAVAVFGSGLVGGSIIRSLKMFGVSGWTELPINWNNPKQRTVDFKSVSSAVGALTDVSRLDIVWAAGSAGFGATAVETQAELPAFRDFLDWTVEQANSSACRIVTLHLISSAGGLFEGQRFVDANSLPKPQRAYGMLKLEQERLVGTISSNLPVCVYRPSSIYGTGGKKARAGLINTLILNHKKQIISRIFGGFDTLRDYVLAADIGQFVAGQTLVSHNCGQTFLLASGKPTSVAEIIGIIEKILRAPLLVKLDPVPSNASHITFRSSALPAAWRPTDLETGIRKELRQLSAQFEAVRF